jgi:hypothetical protein
VPSSNLLPSVLGRNPLMGEASKAELLLSLNTQPYTLFGLCIIVGGWLAPALVFLFGALLATLNRVFTAVWIQLGLLYFVFMANLGYGGEVVIANALHASVSLLVFLVLMRVYTRVRGLRELPV